MERHCSIRRKPFRLIPINADIQPSFGAIRTSIITRTTRDDLFMAAGGLTSKCAPASTSRHLTKRGLDRKNHLSLHLTASRHPPRRPMPSEGMIAMEFDTSFDRWLRAHGIGPLRLARKARLSRLTVFRLRKGSLGRASTRVKLAAACSAFTGRRVTEVELFATEVNDGHSLGVFIHRQKR